MSRLTASLLPCLLLLCCFALLTKSWDYSPAMGEASGSAQGSGGVSDGRWKDGRLTEKKSFLDTFPWLSTQHLKRQQMRYQQCYFNPISCF